MYQILFFYGFLSLSSSLWEFFFVTTLEVPYLIQSGELDLFFIRPLNILYQFVIFQLDEEAIFEFISSIIILGIAMYNLSMSISFAFILKFSLFILSSVLIREAIYLALVSISFFSIQNDGIKSILWQIYQLANYPLSIYPYAIKVILIIIPFSLVGYYPVLNLLNNSEVISIDTFILVLIGPIALIIVYILIWNTGLKKYMSTGS